MKIMLENDMEKAQPFFSIVIATYNRPQQVASCLQSLTQLDYPRDCFEVIVVDDGSAMPLDTVVYPFQNQLDITLIRQSNAGIATARNAGALLAKGKFLAFTDDDCRPAPDWLLTLAARFAVAPESMLGNRTLNALPDNPYSTATQILTDYLYEYYNTNPDQARFFTGNSIALSTDRFWAIDGFDKACLRMAGEDREICDRWLALGYNMIYAPEAKIYHAHHLTFRTFWRQHFNYGRSAFYFRKVRSQRTQEPIRVEPKSFYLNLLVYPFLTKVQQPALLLTALLFVSQVATTVGFFWEKINQTKGKAHVG